VTPSTDHAAAGMVNTTSPPWRSGRGASIQMRPRAPRRAHASTAVSAISATSNAMGHAGELSTGSASVETVAMKLGLDI
jgi:hypothetical protein